VLRVVQRTALLRHEECRLHSKTGMEIILDMHFPFILSVQSVTEPLEKAEKDCKIFHSANCQIQEKTSFRVEIIQHE